MTRADQDFAVAARAFVDANDIESMERVAPRVARLHTHSHRDLAIKIFDDVDATAARSERLLLDHLASMESPLVRTQRRVIEVDRGAIKSNVLATQWERGHKLAYGDIDDATWRALGSSLAALHTSLGTGNAFALPDLNALAAARHLSRERARIVDDAAQVSGDHGDRFARYFAERLRLLDAHGARAPMTPSDDDGPLHNDYNEHNYLFDDGAPPLILDFERAAFGAREFEVVRCLNHLPLVAALHARTFVAGYLAVRPLDGARLQRAVHAALTMHALKHWPVEKLLAREPRADALVEGMAELVTAFVDGADALARFFAQVAP